MGVGRRSARPATGSTLRRKGKTAPQEVGAEFLETVDTAIQETEALIAKHQRIKTGLMQDLLTRGIDEPAML